MSEVENTRRPQPPGGEKRGAGSDVLIGVATVLTTDAVKAVGKAAYHKVKTPKSPPEKQ
jgi:hypothetical protein